MDKRRSINTKFWEDAWIESLSPNEKLVFLYLLTCPLSNLVGIFQITDKRISFDTGLSEEIVSNALKGFETVKKVYRLSDNFIFISNFLKNQSLNSNMKKGVIDLCKELPMSVKDRLKINPSEGFESLSNGLGKYEMESEIEDEKRKGKGKNEITVVGEKKSPTLYHQFVKSYFDFIKSINSVPPKFDGPDGKNMKKLIVTMTQKVKEKTPEPSDQQILEAWNYVLSCRDLWPKFQQGNLKVQQIYSDIDIIINSIRNGKSGNSKTSDREISEIISGQFGNTNPETPVSLPGNK